MAWTHVFEQTNILYQLDYGIGAKVQGVEQFRMVFKGYGHTCMIYDLMPKYSLISLQNLIFHRTTYRFRVRPVLSKTNSGGPSSPSKDREETYGEWSNIINITTRDCQKLDPATFGGHAKMITKAGKNYIEFDKPGMVTTQDPYVYGKTTWEIELKQHSAHQMTDDSNSFIKVGVTNKSGKTYQIFGSLVNYGLLEDSTTIKVILDLDSRSLTVYSSTNPYGETTSNLPEGPLYPAFQNKTNKNSNFSLCLFIKFDLNSN